MKKSKPILKPLDSIVGIIGDSKITNYLTSIFNTIGFEIDHKGLSYFAYKGLFKGKELKIHVSLLKQRQYKGHHPDHLVRYQIFKGIRMIVEMPSNNTSRFIVSKKTKGFLLKAITKVVMKYKGYKKIESSSIPSIYPEVWSPHEKFATTFLKNKEIEKLILELNQKKTKTISWGMIIEPNNFSFNSTFENLDEFEVDKLNSRLEYIVRVAQISDSISTSN